MTETISEKKYFYTPKHHYGTKTFTSKKKSFFYGHMHNLYKLLAQKGEELLKMEKWLEDYDGSEYALIECKNVRKFLEERTKDVLIRYQNRLNRFKK